MSDFTEPIKGAQPVFSGFRLWLGQMIFEITCDYSKSIRICGWDDILPQTHAILYQDLICRCMSSGISAIKRAIQSTNLDQWFLLISLYEIKWTFIVDILISFVSVDQMKTLKCKSSLTTPQMSWLSIRSAQSCVYQKIIYSNGSLASILDWMKNKILV